MLDAKEVRDLILGKMKYRKCPCCDNNGVEYWDGETGMGASPSPSGINPEWLVWGSCEIAMGLVLFCTTNRRTTCSTLIT